MQRVRTAVEAQRVRTAVEVQRVRTEGRNDGLSDGVSGASQLVPGVATRWKDRRIRIWPLVGARMKP